MYMSLKMREILIHNKGSVTPLSLSHPRVYEKMADVVERGSLCFSWLGMQQFKGTDRDLFIFQSLRTVISELL